jgi:hypothetical protein
LVADAMIALEAREYDRAMLILEEAHQDHPDDRELASVLAAVEMKLECLKLLEVYNA